MSNGKENSTGIMKIDKMLKWNEVDYNILNLTIAANTNLIWSWWFATINSISCIFCRTFVVNTDKKAVIHYFKTFKHLKYEQDQSQENKNNIPQMPFIWKKNTKQSRLIVFIMASYTPTSSSNPSGCTEMKSKSFNVGEAFARSCFDANLL